MQAVADKQIHKNFLQLTKDGEHQQYKYAEM